MANTTKKEEIREARMATDSTIRELQETVDALPRTDHMTLPAIQITEIDPQTRARMESIVSVNNAKNGEDTINEEGKTLQEVRNEFTFGVSDLSEEGAKHEIEVGQGEDGLQTVTIIPPVIEVTNAEGEVEEVQDESTVIEPTPANIAPIDKDAPHDPVEARVAAGLPEDGSKGDPVGTVAPPVNRVGAPEQPRTVAPNADQNLGTAPKVGGGGTEGTGTGGTGNGGTGSGNA